MSEDDVLWFTAWWVATSLGVQTKEGRERCADTLLWAHQETRLDLRNLDEAEHKGELLMRLLEAPEPYYEPWASQDRQVTRFLLPLSHRQVKMRHAGHRRPPCS